MCGPGFAPTRVLALPSAETGTMAPEQLSQVVYGEALAMAGDNRAKRAAIEAERRATEIISSLLPSRAVVASA